MLTKSLRSHLIFYALIILILGLISSCAPFTPQVYTDEEQQWLTSQEGKLDVLFGYEAPPNAFHDSDGEYKGLLVDFLDEIEKEIGVSFVFHHFSQWNDLIEYSKVNHKFIVVGIATTENRRTYLSFTDPFIKVPYVIVAQRSSNIKTTEDLLNKKICTVANYAINDFLAEKFPALTVSPVSDNREGLRGVSTGIFDAMVLNQMYASFIIEEQGITNLKIAGESGYLNRLSAAASVQDPILAGILEKAVDQITPRTKHKLYQKWLGQPIETVSRTLLTTLLGVILCVTTLLAISWAWNISLKKTVQKRTRDIIQSRENYKTTLKSIGDGVITTDANGVITGLNRIAEELVGWKEEKALGMPLANVFKIVDTHTRETLHNPAEQVISSGEAINHRHNPTLISTTGQEYVIDDSAAPIQDSQGNIFGVILVFHDITHRYRTQQKLLKSEQQLKQYISHAPIGVAVLNLRYEFIQVNKKICEFSGYDEDELLQKELKDLLPKSYHTDLAQGLHQAREYGTSNISPEFTHKNGTNLFSSIDIGFVTNDKYLIFFNDINQQKLAEEELLKMNKLRSIGTLAGGIAHDFNNILMGIFGNIDIAKEMIDQDHNAYEFLHRAGKSLGRASRLTQQLLTFSKGGAPVKEHTQILTLIREAIDFDLAGSNVLPVVSCEPEIWLTDVDKGQIGQVLSNLFINAKQAMPDGGQLSIDLTNCEIEQISTLPLESGVYVKITITDTGMGIEKEHLSRIFDPYFSTKQTGSGLGLASTYSIVVKHKGHIQVHSTIGEGTTFTLYLPASRKTSLQTTKNKTIDTVHLKDCRILAMDDDLEILYLIERMLTKTKAQLTTTVCGEEAIIEYKNALKEDQPYDMVILDLTVPGAMGGQETAAHILKIDPTAKLIVSSGYAEDPVLANHKKYGFTDVLSKPYTKIAFLEAIGRIVVK